jgi:YVTN family beta-propeller protein
LKKSHSNRRGTEFAAIWVEGVRMRFRQLLALLLSSSSLAAVAEAVAPSYLLFESGHVRPLALSPSGDRLFAVNTPDNQLEIFDVDVQGDLSHAGSVPVGMEPVAVAARSDTEVWVVNHLSDSVSIVDLSGTPRVVRTLLVGDEPNDIVFAGPSGSRAFVSAAHRGQNSPYPAGEYASVSQGRADVYVFDASDQGTSLEGDRLAVITLFGDKPRALATSPNGNQVYVAVFHSGNQTTAIHEGAVCNTTTPGTLAGPCLVGLVPNQSTAPGGLPTPHRNHNADAGPETGLIVKLNRDGVSPTAWQDELGNDWSPLVKFDLPDQDVFIIDANASPPTEVTPSNPFTGVGTVLFNMVVNPNPPHRIYVSNSDAQNHVRFEGHGDHIANDPGLKPPGEPATVKGNLAQSRITVLDPGSGSVTPRHLNPHIAYPAFPVPNGVKEKSLATPMGMATDGTTLYVAAFGSNEIGIFDIAELENGTFTPDGNDHIAVGGGGPSGLVLSGDRLYVTTRFDNSVRVFDVVSKTELQKLALPDREPDEVVDGRPFLYDAQLTSANGEASCSSCHIFGDMDDLAWDLGDPDGDVAANSNGFREPPGDGGLPREFHPMKGVMTTQSLRGLDNMGPQHWRGDRQGDEVTAFEAFNVAFPGLIGREDGSPAGQLTTAEMQAFRKFALEIRYPPNPIRQLNNELRNPPSGPNEQDGFTLYTGPVTDLVHPCSGCHVIDALNGHFGSDGLTTFEGEPQHFKIPHLRNAYQKVGMFGMPDVSLLAFPIQQFDPPFSHLGPQIRGFGFQHDGAIDTLFRFTSAFLFTISPTEQENLEAFIMSFPSDLAPIVGQQVTLTAALLAGADAADVNGRADLMVARAAEPFTSGILGGIVTECDLIAKLVESGGTRITGYLRQTDGTFLPDDGGPAIGESTLRGKATSVGQELTYSCAPPGSGVRMGIDRDEDDVRNGIDTCPAAPNGPGGGTCTMGTELGAECQQSIDCGTGGFCSLAQEDSNADGIGDACDPILLPEPAQFLQIAAGLFCLRAVNLRRRRRAIAERRAGSRTGPRLPIDLS